MGNNQPTFLLIPTKKQVIYQLSYTNKNMCAQNRKKITESDDVSTVINSPLSYEELTSALSNLKLKKSPGPDAITNEMIVNLGQPALHKLLDIFNKTWQEGTLPQIWREATMIPIHKKVKQKQKPRATDQLA